MTPTGSDRVDEAMVARTRERFASERRRMRRRRRRAARSGALPTFMLIGGLKCGTTSLHQYLNSHPEIVMSRPKEIGFFIPELTWELGTEWYASHFDRSAEVRGESSPHYTNRPRFDGVAERMRAVLGEHLRLIYMVRHPIDRMVSHYLHNVRAGYDDRPLHEALAEEPSTYVDRSRYAFQLEPYLEVFGREQIAIFSREDLGRDRYETMKRIFSFLGVNPEFRSTHFDREWWVGNADVRGHFRLMERAVRLPGLRALDRSVVRLPEPLLWLAERTLHPPSGGTAPKPEVPAELRARLAEVLAPDVGSIEAIAGRPFGWQLM